MRLEAIAIAEVHPRSRGEYGPMQMMQQFAQGSPPLTRGILWCKIRKLPELGFTPAHAGNTRSAYSNPYMQQVHPRSRGEYASHNS